MGTFFEDFIFLCRSTLDGIFYSLTSIYFVIEYLFFNGGWSAKGIFTLMTLEVLYFLVFIRMRLNLVLTKRFCPWTFLSLLAYAIIFYTLKI